MTGEIEGAHVADFDNPDRVIAGDVAKLDAGLALAGEENGVIGRGFLAYGVTMKGISGRETRLVLIGLT